VFELRCSMTGVWGTRIVRAMWVLALGSSLACTSARGPTGSPPPAAGWIQTWSDEFEGPAGARIDSTKWSYDMGDGCARANCGWGNKEKEYYTDSPSNIALNGRGQLMIIARMAPGDLRCYYGRCLYTSAKITTRDKMLVEPGRVEARIKLSAGQGLWPAFWMLGRDVAELGWPAGGEIDIMENKGSEPAISSSAIHGRGYSGATPFTRRNKISRTSLTYDFHIFAVEWDSLGAKFYVDNVPHYSVTRAQLQRRGRSILGQPFFVILNLAVGGTFDGDPQSDAIFPATMLVDYVRVYRRESK
jgi:beta-glucanase (GH16 family)